MLDWNAISGHLSAKLDKRHVKPASTWGPKGDYIEGWHAMAEANRIFGFNGWSYYTREIKCVSERDRPIGKDKKPGFGVTYTAEVVVLIGAGEDQVQRTDVGAGHGYDLDLGLAHESAIKEAVTDALKRALRSFGNPFGLALYDKTRANVGTPEPIPHHDIRSAFVRPVEPPHDPVTGEIPYDHPPHDMGDAPAPENATSDGLRNAWEDGIRDRLPDGYTQRQFDEARAAQLTVEFLAYKTTAGLEGGWAKYWQALSELETGAPDLHATLLAVKEQHGKALKEAPPKKMLTKQIGENIIAGIGLCGSVEDLEKYTDELGESDNAHALDHPKIKQAFADRRRVLAEPVYFGDRQIG
jgi:DNA recombination protein Rad52